MINPIGNNNMLWNQVPMTRGVDSESPGENDGDENGAAGAVSPQLNNGLLQDYLGTRINTSA